MNENQLLIHFGTDPYEAAWKLMEASSVWENWNRSESIGLKPNLVVSKKASSGATTHPEFTEGVIAFLKDKGFTDLTILEGSWVGDSTEKAFQNCGYVELGRKYDVPLIDLQKDESVSCESTKGDYRICRSVLNLDRLINLPVLKGHCQTYMTCALKNLKGCIPDSEKRRFHREGLHQPIADLNEILKADLILVDGLNGDPDFEEGGNPLEMNFFMAAVDPVLTDSYVASMLGLSVQDVPYISKAEVLGAGSVYSNESEIIYLNKGEKIRGISRTAKSRRLKSYIDDRGACSACYSSLMEALSMLESKGIVPEAPLKIGQEYKGIKTEGKGIGICLSDAESFVQGCPPSSENIISFITEI